MEEEEEKKVRDTILDFYVHESVRINERTDWFLIFNAIIIEALVNIPTDKIIFSILIFLFAHFVAFIWLVVGIRGWWKIGQLGGMLNDSKKVGTAMNDFFVKLYTERKEIPKLYRWASDGPTLSIVVPLISWIFWSIAYIFFLYSQCELSRSICIYLLPFILELLAAILIWLIGPAPKKFLKKKDAQ